MKEVKKWVVWPCGRTRNTKALGQEGAWPAGGTARRPVRLECNE